MIAPRKHLTSSKVNRLLAAIRGSRNEVRDRCLLSRSLSEIIRQTEYVCPNRRLDLFYRGQTRKPRTHQLGPGVTKSSRIRNAADDPFSTRMSRMKRTASRTLGSRFSSNGLPYTYLCSRTSRRKTVLVLRSIACASPLFKESATRTKASGRDCSPM